MIRGLKRGMTRIEEGNRSDEGNDQGSAEKNDRR